jgi:hypothetical protein
MWTKENRHHQDRIGLRYDSDLTDEEWAKIAPLIPPAKLGQQAIGQSPLGDERPEVHPQHGLPMARDPQGSGPPLQHDI